MLGFAIYIASRTEQENQLLKRKLESLRSEFRQLSFVGLHPQGLALSASEKMAVAVINVPEWTPSEAATLIGLRSAGYYGPVLVIAKLPAIEVLKRLKAMDGVVFLERPFEAKDLLGIMKKMLNARAVSQRVHRRFNTDEFAEVAGVAGKLQSRVGNMSKGGAYLEFSDPATLNLGEVVKVTMELKDVNRTYTVQARVVWVGRALNSRADCGVGVQFLGSPEVTRNMFGEF